MATILNVIVCPVFVENHTGIRKVTAMPVDIVNISITADRLSTHSARFIRVLHSCGTCPSKTLFIILLSISAHTIIHETSVGKTLENTIGHEYTISHLPYYSGGHYLKQKTKT